MLAEVGHESVQPDPRSLYSPSVVPLFLLSEGARIRKARLAEVISAEIIPRLLLVHHEIRVTAANLKVPGQAEIAEFAALVMDHEVAPATTYFERMLEKGYALETLFVQLLAPTAGYLGEL